MSEDIDKYGYEDGLEKGGSRLRENPFSVPDGYFDQLGDMISFRSKLEAPAGKDALTRKGGEFSVPEGYFEGLEDRILGRLAETELKSRLSDPGFTVPDGYFESLDQRILDRTALEGKTGREVPVRKLLRPAWIRYAAAACVLIVSAFFIKNNMQVSDRFDLSSIPDEELVDYLQLYGDTRDMMLFSEYSSDLEYKALNPEISRDEIQWYLDNTL